MTKRISKYLDMLRRRALNSQLNNRHAAILFSNKETYIGHNNKRTYYNGDLVPSTHAEMEVLNKRTRIGSNNKGKFSIFVIRINRDGHLCNSKPCHECIKNLKTHNVNKIYYSDDDGNIVCEFIKKMENDPSTGFRHFDTL